MTEPVATESMAATIAEQLTDVTAETVSAVLTTWNLLRDGDPIGTVRRGPNGELAHRVSADGVHLWQVSTADGATWRDLAATLPDWPIISSPDA